MKIISGKNKDGFEENNHIKFVFSNRLSVFDEVVGEIEGRGEILAECTRVVFEYLSYNNIKTAMIEGKGNYILMEKCETLPFEFIMRNILAGSALVRAKNNILTLPEGMECKEFTQFPEPFVETSTKREAKDRYDLSRDEIIQIMKDAFPSMKESKAFTSYEDALKTTKKISKVLTTLFNKAGFTLADAKIELGYNKEGKLCLIDSFGPDEFRAVKRDEFLNNINMKPDFYDKEFIRNKLRGATKEEYPTIIQEHGRTLVERYIFVTDRLREASEKLCQN